LVGALINLSKLRPKEKEKEGCEGSTTGYEKSLRDIGGREWTFRKKY